MTGSSRTAPPSSLLAPAVDAVLAGARLALAPGEELRIDTKQNRNDVVTQVDRAVEALIAERLAPLGFPLLGEEGHTVDSWRGRVWVLDPIDGTLNYVAVHRHWAISLALVEDGHPVLGVVADPVDGWLYTAVEGAGARASRIVGLLDGGADDAAAAAQDFGGEPLRIDDVPLADGVVIAHLYALVGPPFLADVIADTRGMRCYGAAAIELTEVAAGRAGCLVHTELQPWDMAAGMLVCREAGAVVTRIDGGDIDVRERSSVLAGTPSAHAAMLRRLARG